MVESQKSDEVSLVEESGKTACHRWIDLPPWLLRPMHSDATPKLGQAWDEAMCSKDKRNDCHSHSPSGFESLHQSLLAWKVRGLMSNPSCPFALTRRRCCKVRLSGVSKLCCESLAYQECSIACHSSSCIAESSEPHVMCAESVMHSQTVVTSWCFDRSRCQDWHRVMQSFCKVLCLINPRKMVRSRTIFDVSNAMIFELQSFKRACP